VTLVNWAKRASRGNSMAAPSSANARTVSATRVSSSENPAPVR
jgi:hypothetical protein